MSHQGAVVAGRVSPEMRIGTRWPIMIALMLSVAVIMLDNSVLNVALPAIGAALHAGISQLQWVVTAYSLTFGGLLLTTGNLADRLGRKRVLVVGLSVMAAGSALVPAVHSAVGLVAVRALIGAGAALAMPSTLSLVYVTFAGPIRQKAVGIWSTVSMAGVVFGPLVAGLMLTRLSWQWLFLINIPVALVAVPVVLAVVPESSDATGEPADLAGAVLSIGFMGALIYALSSGPDRGWRSERVVTTFAAAGVLLALFCWRQLTTRHPMLDLQSLASRGFAVPALVEGTAFLAMASIMFIQTQLVQLVLGFTPLVCGLLTLPVVAVMAAVNTPIARLSTRVPTRLLIAGGLATAATGSLLVAAWPGSLWAIAGGMCIVMVGVRASLTTVAIEIIDALPPERAGIGSALNDTFQEIGAALGVAVLGALLNQAYRGDLPSGAPPTVRTSISGAVADPAWLTPARHAFAHGATVALTTGSALLLVISIHAVLLHRPAPHQEEAEGAEPQRVSAGGGESRGRG
jgi:MFS transporter, DHA2 family, multidrug resistance protein